MSIEYEKGKREALEKLAATCASNLRQIQQADIQAEFSFRDNWGWLETEGKKRHKSGILRTLLDIPSSLQMWAKYTYKDGSITGEVIQNECDRVIYGEIPKTIVITPDFDINNIPFAKFAEADLLKAAKTIEAHLPHATNHQTQVA